MVLSVEGREFKKTMCAMVAARHLPMTRGPVAVTLVFSFRTRHKRDVDNFSKATLDCLKGVMFEDDSDITELHLHKALGAEADQIYVQCSPIR